MGEMKKGIKEFKRVKPSEITPYFNNPRKNDNAIEGVAESIQSFGFDVPIAVDEEGVILSGHTRWKAALKLELKTVPVVVIEGLTEEEKRAYRIADNKTNEAAGWDFEKLKEEIEGLDELYTGWNDDELNSLFVGPEMDNKEKEIEEMETQNKCPSCGYEF